MSQVSKAIHIYQRSAKGDVIFFTLQDYLVFYTFICVSARKHGIRILGVAIMYNHYHILVQADNRDSIRIFISDITSRFARIYNEETGLSGMLFQSPFGSAVKYGEKNVRTAAGYLYNNHTNKKLCTKAEEIRWNFLAYAHNNNPFSNPIIKEKVSLPLRNALKEIDSNRRADRPLNYATLRRLYKPLGKEEKEQLTDYIITAYNAIDYEALESLYRSPEDMLYSFNANTFNEYDIEEDSEERSGDDRVYNRLAKQVLALGRFASVKDILRLSDDERFRLAVELHARTGVPYKQIGAFVHLKIGIVRHVYKGVEFPPPPEE
ncbi:MAG: transposase [Bacteroidales bacterium]|nr:transposase [Bacteroidales bacterium]